MMLNGKQFIECGHAHTHVDLSLVNYAGAKIIPHTSNILLILLLQVSQFSLCVNQIFFFLFAN